MAGKNTCNTCKQEERIVAEMVENTNVIYIFLLLRNLKRNESFSNYKYIGVLMSLKEAATVHSQYIVIIIKNVSCCHASIFKQYVNNALN